MKQVQPKTNIPILGRKLRQLRGSHTQREVEEIIGLPYGRLTQYEKGRCDVPPDHLEKLLNFYGVRGAELVTKDGYKQILNSANQLARILNAELRIPAITA